MSVGKRIFVLTRPNKEDLKQQIEVVLRRGGKFNEQLETRNGKAKTRVNFWHAAIIRPIAVNGQLKDNGVF